MVVDLLFLHEGGLLVVMEDLDQSS